MHREGVLAALPTEDRGDQDHNKKKQASPGRIG
jgi:hypothetical protein